MAPSRSIWPGTSQSAAPYRTASLASCPQQQQQQRFQQQQHQQRPQHPQQQPQPMGFGSESVNDAVAAQLSPEVRYEVVWHLVSLLVDFAWAAQPDLAHLRNAINQLLDDPAIDPSSVSAFIRVSMSQFDIQRHPTEHSLDSMLADLSRRANDRVSWCGFSLSPVGSQPNLTSIGPSLVPPVGSDGQAVSNVWDTPLAPASATATAAAPAATTATAAAAAAAAAPTPTDAPRSAGTAAELSDQDHASPILARHAATALADRPFGRDHRPRSSSSAADSLRHLSPQPDLPPFIPDGSQLDTDNDVDAASDLSNSNAFLLDESQDALSVDSDRPYSFPHEQSDHDDRDHTDKHAHLDDSADEDEEDNEGEDEDGEDDRDADRRRPPSSIRRNDARFRVRYSQKIRSHRQSRAPSGRFTKKS